MRWLIVGVAAALLVGSGGCAKRSEVHGTVRYQGKLLTRGTIIFLAPDKRAYPVAIGRDGSYRIASLPRGTILIAVQVEAQRPLPRPAPSDKDGDAFGQEKAKSEDAAKSARAPAPPPATTPEDFPAIYGDPHKSGLSFELRSSVQEHSIDLP
jgi:hypothetical protein